MKQEIIILFTKAPTFDNEVEIWQGSDEDYPFVKYKTIREAMDAGWRVMDRPEFNITHYIWWLEKLK